MAPSLQDLIDFLLAEVALCGDQGASPSDILAFIDVFYKSNQNALGHRTQKVDRRFQEKVWSWLTRNPEVSIGKNKEGNHLSLTEAENAPSNAETAEHPVRVFVSEERTWLAITGHEPDETKVLPTEFALLSIIASRKSEGIPQTELVIVSGQDKRSVPKRTEMLQQKGYIDKRGIQMKSARTSLCTLRRFFNPEKQMAGAPANAMDKSTRMVDFAMFNDRLFDILGEFKIIARNDLKKRLNLVDAWEWRVLSRALRKFERIGVLKRVRALSQYADTFKKFHPCVKLLRDPTEKDFELFHEFSKSILTNLEQEDGGELDEDLDRTAQEPSSTNADTTSIIKRETDVEESGRILPTWTPDRIMHNLIFEAVDKAGTSGITNFGIIRTCFGSFYRRPLENTLTRLVECWQLSQPLHLRHLGIVRDTGLEKTIIHYVHYTVANFQKLVDSGEATWEAVEFTPKGPKSVGLAVPPVDAIPQLDEYGLPIAVPGNELLKNGNATLMQCIMAVKPADYVMSGSDPMAVKLQDGQYRVRYGHQKLPHGMRQHFKPLGRPKGSLNRPKVEYEDSQNLDEDDLPIIRPPPKSKYDRLKGMSEKEKLEALGLDETWTEYNILLMERPTPGVYITPRGRRRPAGKRQGRPRISRLAVFKSPKLKDLPWFVEEGARQAEASHAQDNETPTVAPVPAEHASSLASTSFQGHIETPDISTTPSRGAKRSFQRLASFETPSAGTAASRRSKHRRLNELQADESPTVASTDQSSGSPQANEVDIPYTIETASSNPLKRHRAQSPSSRQQDSIMEVSNAATGSGENEFDQTRVDGTLAKKPRLGVQPSQERENILAPETETTRPSTISEPLPKAEQNTEASSVLPTTPSHDATITGQRIDLTTDGQGQATSELTKSEKADEGDVKFQEGTRKRIRKNTDKGGSVPLLRRKIVTDIVEKAGGAYPMGTELWYPFMTAWMKTKYKEKPDLRTLRNTVKQLIDSGKLRQSTFSGKDSKGVMVTKKILFRSDLEPDGPIVQDLQKNMLNTEARFYFPPNTEIDPGISKSGLRGPPIRDPKLIPQLPVEDGLTVHLHQKPAVVLAQEKRRGQLIQKRLLESLQIDREARVRRSTGVPRLLKIQRASDGTMKNLTSISRPHTGGDDEQKDGRTKRVINRRPWRPISSMIMNPKSTFHSSTGTFATHAGLAALRTVDERYMVRPFARPLTRPGALPQSLEEIFDQTRRRFIASDRTESEKFFLDTNRISRWEIQNEELFGVKSADLRYINQGIQSFEPVPLSGNIRFDVDEEIPLPTPRGRVTTRRKARRSRKSAGEEIEAEPNFETFDPSNYVPQSRRLTKLNELLTSDGPDPIPTPARTLAPSRPARRQRLAYQLPDMLVKKILTAIVVVRTLTGGAEGRVVDWVLVTRCFPDHDPKFIQERAKLILNRNRLQTAKMQSDFQERFIEAYEKDQVPRINYDDLDAYDWGAVVDWAITELDTPTSEKIPDLPATREQFDSVFELREEAPTTLDEVYQGIQSITVNRKRTLFVGVPFAVPLPDKTTKIISRKAELSRLESAKSWVRANIIAPEESYRPADARKALEMFGDPLVGSAVQSLVTERVIAMGNGGRIMPGRNYDITDFFLYTLGRKRAIESPHLRRAARFKTTVLDPALQANGTFDVKYNSDDGDILALINLAAAGKITMKPRDPPREKYGLTDGGYLTRQMNKDKLRFAIEVQPLESYVYGNPIQERMSSLLPPSPPKDAVDPATSLPGKLPIWIDIHGQFVRVIWDLVVAAVVGCIAMRPGINAMDIGNSVKPVMGIWEVELLLEWMANVGAVESEVSEKSDRKGWVVKEWWWMLLG